MTRITTPFGSQSTAAEVAAGIDLSGKRVITGAASGIGAVLLATSPLLAGIGGRYFVDCSVALVVTHRTTDMSGVAPYALDPQNADRLWDESLRMISLGA